MLVLDTLGSTVFTDLSFLEFKHKNLKNLKSQNEPDERRQYNQVQHRELYLRND